MLIRLDGSGPLHRQLHRAVRDAVLKGVLAPGTHLPPTRTLATELGVSRSVVVRAFERLAAEGVVVARVGSGTYVSEGFAGPPDALPRGPTQNQAPAALSRWAEKAGDLLQARSDREPPPYDFRYGRVDPQAFPHTEWRRSVRRALRLQSVEYAHPEGAPALRRALAAYLGRSRGVRCAPEQILVVTGSQQALDLTARVLLDAGDTVALEEPQYQGARHTFLAAGAHLLLRTVDAEGITPPGEGERVPVPRLIYVTPSHQFPSGGVLSLPRRLALLEWARRAGAWVLEDDYDAEFRYDLPPVEAMQALDEDGRVIYAGTFSKVLFPSLRLGYLVLPPALVDPFRTAKWLVDRHSPTLEQEALAHFIAEGAYDRHLRRTRLAYQRRRATLLEALEAEMSDCVRVVGAAAGVHVLAWLDELPEDRLGALLSGARKRGVGVYPVTPYYAEAPPGAGLLLGYAALSPDRIIEGVRRLRLSLDDLGR